MDKKNISLFVLLLIIGVVIFPNIYSIENVDLSYSNTITLTNQEISIPIKITNPTDSSQLYTFKLHTYPFISSINPPSIWLSPREYAYLSLKIKPLNNSLTLTQMASLEVIINEETSYFAPLTIIQNQNVECPLDLTYNISYDINKDIYNLILQINNNSNLNIDLILNDLNGVSGFTSKTLNINSKTQTKEYFDINVQENSELVLNYVCNHLEKNIEIIVPEKPEQETESISVLSGFVGLWNGLFKNHDTNVSEDLNNSVSDSNVIGIVDDTNSSLDSNIIDPSCPVSLTYDVNFLSGILKYRIYIYMYNNSDNTVNISLDGFTDLNVNPQSIDLNAYELAKTFYHIDTNNEFLVLNYTCNDIQNTMNIQLKEQDEENNNNLTGFFSLGNVFTKENMVNFFNSLVFQITLVCVLVIMILFFTTRYIKFSKDNK